MPWVDISEAAFTLGVSERTIRNWIKSGKLEARNAGGRREVEIPDPEASSGAHAYADEDAGEGQPLEVQKRLEVALIECGRVKGTLASQERMMENLSSNIAELNAKLQKSERVIGRRTLWCVVVAFLGVVAYLGTRAYYDSQRTDMVLAHEQDKDHLQTSFGEEKAQLKEQHSQTIQRLIDQKHKERMAALDALRGKLELAHKNEMAALKREFGARVESLEKDALTLRHQLDDEKARRMKAETELASLQKEMENAEARQAQAERLINLQKERLAEVEKSRTQLEEELARWKAHYRREPPRD